MTARLPTPGGDSGTWGDVLNTFLAVGHDANGYNIGYSFLVNGCLEIGDWTTLGTYAQQYLLTFGGFTEPGVDLIVVKKDPPSTSAGVITGVVEYTGAIDGFPPAGVYGAGFATPGNGITQTGLVRGGDFDVSMNGAGIVDQIYSVTMYAEINSGTANHFGGMNLNIDVNGGTVGDVYGFWITGWDNPTGRATAIKIETSGLANAKAIVTGADPVEFGGDLSVAGHSIIRPPTSDPHVAGALWNNSGTLAISAG